MSLSPVDRERRREAKRLNEQIKLFASLANTFTAAIVIAVAIGPSLAFLERLSSGVSQERAETQLDLPNIPEPPVVLQSDPADIRAQKEEQIRNIATLKERSQKLAEMNDRLQKLREDLRRGRQELKITWLTIWAAAMVGIQTLANMALSRFWKSED